MTVNTIKPLRLTKAVLLKADPICQETTAFRKIYDSNVVFSDLYTHDVLEIGLVVSGNGVHRILNQDIPCKAGDIFIIHPDSPHGYFSSEPDESLIVRRLWFDASDWFEGPVATPNDPRYCHGVFCDSAITAYAILTGRTQAEINGYYNAIALEISEKKQEWREAVKSHMTMLLITVGRYVGGAIKNLPTELSKDWCMVASAIRIVTERFGDCDLKLETIADALFISQSHMSRLFKRCTGESFSDYLRAIRINYACRLLEDTVLTVDEIAKQCGLRDIPSFYHSFNLQTGMTPHQYRTKKSNIINSIYMNKGELIMSILNEISENLQRGKAKLVKELVQKAIDEGVSVEKILNEGLLHGMNIIGEKFKNNEVYVPEVLVAARAMNMGTQVIKPYLAESGIVAKGRVCIGTVQGDLHDIGKNLVKMMMEGKGLEVVDLGTDVSAETFIKTAVEQNCQVICCSALLTTTMGVMEEVVRLANEQGLRDKIKIMVGGAPVNEDFCRKIGADVYTSDAASAADAAVALCNG